MSVRLRAERSSFHACAGKSAAGKGSSRSASGVTTGSRLAFGHRRAWLAVVILAIGVVAGFYVFRTAMVVILMLSAAAFNMTVASLEARWRLYVWRHQEPPGSWPGRSRSMRRRQA